MCVDLRNEGLSYFCVDRRNESLSHLCVMCISHEGGYVLMYV